MPKPGTVPDITVTEKRIKLSAIVLDPRTETRAAWNEQVVGEYKEVMRIEEFPNIVVFEDPANPGVYYLADGHYRLAAIKLMGKTTTVCDVRVGGINEARFWACSANSDHGQPRTYADKEKVVLMLLKDPDWVGRSSGWYAAKCNVSKPFVRKIQAKHGIEVPAFVIDTNGDKKPSTQNKKQKAEEFPQPDIDPADDDENFDSVEDYEAPSAPVPGQMPAAIPVTKKPGPKQYPSPAPAKPNAEPALDSEGVVLDATKLQVPKKMRQVFADAAEFDVCQTEIAKLFARIRNMKAKPAGAALDLAHVENAIQQLRGHLKSTRPHTTCTACDGAKCEACKDRGWTTK